MKELGNRISGVRVHKLYDILDDEIIDFLKKNDKMTNEELHLVFYRLYLNRELMPTINMMNQFSGEMDKDDKTGTYIQ